MTKITTDLQSRIAAFIAKKGLASVEEATDLLCTYALNRMDALARDAAKRASTLPPKEPKATPAPAPAPASDRSEERFRVYAQNVATYATGAIEEEIMRHRAICGANERTPASLRFLAILNAEQLRRKEARDKAPEESEAHFTCGAPTNKGACGRRVEGDGLRCEGHRIAPVDPPKDERSRITTGAMGEEYLGFICLVCGDIYNLDGIKYYRAHLKDHEAGDHAFTPKEEIVEFSMERGINGQIWKFKTRAGHYTGAQIATALKITSGRIFSMKDGVYQFRVEPHQHITPGAYVQRGDLLPPTGAFSCLGCNVPSAPEIIEVDPDGFFWCSSCQKKESEPLALAYRLMREATTLGKLDAVWADYAKKLIKPEEIRKLDIEYHSRVDILKDELKKRDQAEAEAEKAAKKKATPPKKAPPVKAKAPQKKAPPKKPAKK